METLDALSNYFLNIIRTLASLLYGLKITFRHFLAARKMRTPVKVADKEYFTQKDGIVTLQYPKEEFPVPDNGRYQLHNEIDDCIVCDKCAKVCPVNCIDIEPVRATEEIGLTSDGTPKRIYAAKFDIDMSKCCFCGLCTVVCPTECLTMTKEYDFSVFDLKEHNFEFSDMSETQIAEKKEEFDVFQAEKEKAKAEAAALKVSKDSDVSSLPKVGVVKPKTAKPAFRPKLKKKEDGEVNSEAVSQKSEESSQEPKVTSQKPVFRPKVKKKEEGSEKSEEVSLESEKSSQKPNAKTQKPVFRPKIKPKKKE
ncbi:MAG: 4Fe-4S binding protein [Reichenbachiella sp.]